MNKKTKQKVLYSLVALGYTLFMFILIYQSYSFGFSDGKMTQCQEQGDVYVNFRGIKQCWTEFRYTNYMEQWNDSISLEGVGYVG